MFILLRLIIHFSVFTSFVIAQPCPKGTFISKTGCQLCPSGTFFNFTGAQTSAACIRCPRNTFASSEGSRSCQPCPSGKSSYEGFKQCVYCPPGSSVEPFPGSPYRDNSSPCNPCWPGTFANETSQLECTSCPGIESIGPPGATSINQCEQCPRGTRSSVFSQGRSPQIFNISCTPGSPKCPLGFTAPPGILSLSQCKPCPSGKVGIEGVSYYRRNECLNCEKGFTTFQDGNTICRKIGTPCPTKYTETSFGDCRRCQVDQYYDPLDFKCKPCAEGTGSAGGLVLKCSPCDVVFNARIEESSCRSYIEEKLSISIAAVDKNGNCVPGTIKSSKFNGCQMCPSDMYTDTVNAKECKSCPPGSIRFSFGGKYCMACPPGSVPRYDTCIVPQTTCNVNLLPRDLISGNPQPLQACSDDQCVTSSCPSCAYIRMGRLHPFASACDVKKCPDEQVNTFSGSVCGCRGQYSLNVGIVNGTCVRCQPGSYGKSMNEEEDNVCVKCVAGTYRVNTTDSDIAGCLSSSRCSLNPCKKCKAGYFTDQDGSTECKKCAPGTFSYGIGDTKCMELNGNTEPVPFDTPLPEVIEN